MARHIYSVNRLLPGTVNALVTRVLDSLDAEPKIWNIRRGNRKVVYWGGCVKKKIVEHSGILDQREDLEGVYYQTSMWRSRMPRLMSLRERLDKYGFALIVYYLERVRQDSMRRALAVLYETEIGTYTINRWENHVPYVRDLMIPHIQSMVYPLGYAGELRTQEDLLIAADWLDDRDNKLGYFVRLMGV